MAEMNAQMITISICALARVSLSTNCVDVMRLDEPLVMQSSDQHRTFAAGSLLDPHVSRRRRPCVSPGYKYEKW